MDDLDSNDAAVTDALDRTMIEARLGTTWLGRPLQVHANLDSTSDEARRMAAEGAGDGTVIVADSQHRGRGSQGRHWSSPAGQDLYFSFILRRPLPVDALASAALAVGVGVSDTVLRLAPDVSAQIKWPNDVLLRDRKVAGVLVETSRGPGGQGPLIVGVGLNVNRPESLFEEPLRDLATSLRREVGRRFDRGAVLALALADIERRLDDHRRAGLPACIDVLNQRLARRGETVLVDGEEVVIERVSASGALEVWTASGARSLLSGRITTVTVRRPTSR